MLPMFRLTVLLTVLSVISLPIAPVLATPILMSQAGVERIRVKESRRIAVLDFEFANVGGNSLFSGGFFGLADTNGPSKGISNLLTNKLVQDGTYIMIERSQVEAILKEQDLGTSGRIEASTAAQIGRILGVDAVIVGSITKFFVESKSKGFSFGSFGNRKKRQIATVEAVARMVSTATAEIISVAEGSGEVEQEDGGSTIFGFTSDSDSNSGNRLLGEAADQAVGQIATQLVESESKLAVLPGVLPVEVMTIADVVGNQVILNRGGQHGFRPGMVVSVERVIKVVKDPETGNVLRRLTHSIGRLQLTNVEPQSSVGRVLAGRGFQVGDKAKAIEQ